MEKKKPGLFYYYNVLARCVTEMKIITNSSNNPYIFTAGENLFNATKISIANNLPLEVNQISQQIKPIQSK